MKTNPIPLLTEMVLHPNTTFSQKEAESFFGSYLSFFQDTNLIVVAPSRKWANCQSCGKTHDVTPLNGLLLLSCPEPGVEDVTITAEELKSVRFNPSGFYTWIQIQFSLQGDIVASDGKVLLGRGTVDGKQRLFMFSHDSSAHSRKELCQQHLNNQPVILYLSNALDNHNQGYDINLADFISVENNSLRIDISSALNMVTSTIPPLENEAQTATGSQIVFELVPGDSEIRMTGTILDGQTYPAFRSKRTSAMYRVFRTLLKLHEDSKSTTFKPYQQSSLEENHISIGSDSQSEISQIDFNQGKRSLHDTCSHLLPYFLQDGNQRGSRVIKFRSAISEADWNQFSDSEKQKIFASKSTLPNPVNP